MTTHRPNRPIYLDNQATTACDPRVVQAMLPFFTEHYGNPHSAEHAMGRFAEAAVEQARAHIAALIGADPREIVLTSGATESNNIAIKGAARHAAAQGTTSRRIVTVATEHKCVLESVADLAAEGFEPVFLPVRPDGLLDPAALRDALATPTLLVSVMAVNNETGVIQNIAALAALAHEAGALFHTDAAQAAGKIPLDVEAMRIDLLSISGHKLYGPKGVGALYVRRRKPRVRLTSLFDGGGQERGFRSGTLNVTGIVGLGKACEIAMHEMDHDGQRLLALRQYMEAEITKQLDSCEVNGHATKRLPHIANISFGFVEGEGLMMAIKDIACSSGSACTSASLEPSYVLKGLGVGDELAHSSLRLSMGRWTTKDEVDFAIKKIVEAVKKLRMMSPLYDMHKEGIDLSKVEWAHH